MKYGKGKRAVKNWILVLGGFAGGLVLCGAGPASPAGTPDDSVRLTVIGEVDDSKLGPIALSGFGG